MNNKSRRRVLSGVVLLLAGIWVLGSMVSAATLAQTFKSDTPLVAGTVVSLAKPEGTVAKASKDNVANLYGVVVSGSDVSFSLGGSQGVQVANDGVLNTLVSTVNGSIRYGDAITVENLEGVGQKTQTVGKIIGVAQGDLDESKARDYTYSENGKDHRVKIGSIPVKIEVSSFTPKSDNPAEARNKFLEIADGIAGKQTRVLAVVLAGLILLVAAFISTFLITSSSYASMISVGRNPLSERKIIQALLRMLFISVGIFATGGLLAYLVLKII